MRPLRGGARLGFSMTEPNGTPADGTEGSRLCLACGLCCSGAVFAFVPIEPDEHARLARKLPVLVDEEGPRFDLPCTAHAADAGCRLYVHRPSTCASYACRQLLAVREGSTSFGDARAIIGEVRALFDRVQAALPGAGWIWHRAAALRAAGLPAAIEERRRHAATLLDLKVLELRVSRDLGEPPFGPSPSRVET